MDLERRLVAIGWQAELVTVPELVDAAGGALDALERIAAGLVVNADRMKANLDALQGLVFSERLARLVIASSLAYVWLHATAGFAQAHGWVEQFHRSDRCDLGLFQIGLRAIQYALREGLRVPVSFRLPIDPPTAPQ